MFDGGDGDDISELCGDIIEPLGDINDGGVDISEPVGDIDSFV